MIQQLMIPVEELPPWADEITVDCDGSICVFEEGAFFEPGHFRPGPDIDFVAGQWIPVDDFDGLCFKYVGKLECTFTDEEASELCFKIERRPASAAAFARAQWHRKMEETGGERGRCE